MTPCIPGRNKPRADGYCKITVAGRQTYEHVLAWEAIHGPVPEGKVLDHLCHDPDECPGGACVHRSCRNVDHLVPVARGDNVRRAVNRNREIEQCPDGHPYDAANTYTNPQGHRHCRACRPKHQASHRRRKAAR